jgi:hypothetical protein
VLWNGQSHVGEKDGVCLKGTFSRAVVLLTYSNCMANNAIAYFETSDGRADLDNLTRDVGTEHKWIFDPGEHHVAHVLL